MAGSTCGEATRLERGEARVARGEIEAARVVLLEPNERRVIQDHIQSRLESMCSSNAKCVPYAPRYDFMAVPPERVRIEVGAAARR